MEERDGAVDGRFCWLAGVLDGDEDELVRVRGVPSS
jgi:hypothetical protein